MFDFFKTSEQSGAALAAFGASPKGRTVLEGLLVNPWLILSRELYQEVPILSVFVQYRASDSCTAQRRKDHRMNDA